LKEQTSDNQCNTKLIADNQCNTKLITDNQCNTKLITDYTSIQSHTWPAQHHYQIVLLSGRGIYWGTGIRGLMRGMATLPQGNQELLVIRDKVGRPQVSLG